jgi:peptidoglycan/xylan/chitin deacetylase (PgdA/CDA1 family)
MNSARRWLRWLWAAALFASGQLNAAAKELRSNGSIVVMMFHRVLEDDDKPRTRSLPGMIMGKRAFEQLARNVTRRYQVVPITATPGGVHARLRFAFTFDDGWADSLTKALPVAQSFGIPLAVFVCTGYAGQAVPFWPERVAEVMHRARRPAKEIEATVERLKTAPTLERERAIASGSNSEYSDSEMDRTMSWAEVLQLESAGAVIGSHTSTHPVLTAIGDEEARKELADSRRVLGQVLAQDCVAFAYPNGNHSARLRQLLAETGYRMAFTTECSAWTLHSDPLEIPRVNVCEDNVVGLSGKFSPLMFDYAVIWKAWRRTRAPRNISHEFRT